jgi:DNA-binding response OmpR family regulator
MKTTPSRRKKILIVEDEDDFATMLAYRLERKGYETVKAFDGWSGLQQMQTQRPDAIVLDLMLPKIVGLDICRLIRRMPEVGRVPIYILTALDMPGYRTKGLASGADGFFSKSHELPELLKRIETVLAEDQAGTASVSAGLPPANRTSISLNKSGTWLPLVK